MSIQRQVGRQLPLINIVVKYQCGHKGTLKRIVPELAQSVRRTARGRLCGRCHVNTL